MNELVSIIVPIYNVEKYLEKCIESIIKQSYKNLEIILVNDGSTDKSKEICNRYKNQDKRILLINKKNNGVSAARNAGLDIAKGKYIAFVDSDDYLESHMIESMLRNINTTCCDMAICGYNIIFEDGKNKVSDNNNITTILKSKEVIELIFRTNKINGFLWNKIFKREILEKFRLDESLDICEDLCLICEILRKDLSICYSSEPLYNYRNTNSSATMSIDKIFMKNGHLKYDLIYKDIIRTFQEDDEIIKIIKIRNVKTIMESYYLVLKKRYRDTNIDVKTLSIFNENIKMYLTSNVNLKFKVIFIAMYIISNIRVLINKIIHK